MADSPVCLTARAKLAQYVSDLRQSTLTEKGVGLVKTGFLSPKTVLKKTAGDIVLGGVENLVTKPLAVGIDYLASLTRSAASFGEHSPAEYRDLANALTPTGVRFGAQGFRDGVAKSIALLKTGIDPDLIGDQFNLQRVTYKSPILNAITRGVYNGLHATVKPWYGLALNLSLYARAASNAAREGLSGAAKGARIDELLAHPTDEMALGAANDAEYATLMNKTAFGEAAAGLKRGLKRASENPAKNAAYRLTAQIGYVGSELTIPFTGVPSAIGGVMVDYSPVGAAKTLAMLVKAAGADIPVEPGLQGKLALGAARSIVGTAALMGLGYALARKGRLTGALPTNPSERARWQAEGKQPYSVLVDGEWHSLTGAAPLGLVPLVAADVAQYTTNQDQRGTPPSRLGQAAQGTAAMGQALTQQSFLQGVSALTDALADPERKAARFGAQLLTAPIPTVVKQATRGWDTTPRSAASFTDKLKSNIPGLAQTVPASLTQFGQPQTRGPGGVPGVLREMLDVTNTRPSTPSAATAEMDRLGVGLPSFGKGLNLPGHPRQSLTPAQSNAEVQEFGPMKQGVVEWMIRQPWYQQLPDDEKKTALEKALRDVQASGTAATKGRALGYQIPRATLEQYLGPAETP